MSQSIQEKRTQKQQGTINTIEDHNAKMQTCRILSTQNDINWNQLDNIMTCQHLRCPFETHPFEGKGRGSSCKFEWGRPDLRGNLWAKPWMTWLLALCIHSLLEISFDMTRLFLETVKFFNPFGRLKYVGDGVFPKSISDAWVLV